MFSVNVSDVVETADSRHANDVRNDGVRDAISHRRGKRDC